MTSQAEPTSDGWRAAAPEICIAAVLVAVAAATGYVAAGLPGAAAVVIGATVVALVVMRAITPLGTPPGDVRQTDAEAVPVTFTGYWRKRAGLVDGTQSLAAYDAVLRGTAAARLTALFYEARFSTHPVSVGQRDAALAALDELSAELGSAVRM